MLRTLFSNRRNTIITIIVLLVIIGLGLGLGLGFGVKSSSRGQAITNTLITKQMLINNPTATSNPPAMCAGLINACNTYLTAQGLTGADLTNAVALCVNNSNSSCKL